MKRRKKNRFWNERRHRRSCCCRRCCHWCRHETLKKSSGQLGCFKNPLTQLVFISLTLIFSLSDSLTFLVSLTNTLPFTFSLSQSLSHCHPLSLTIPITLSHTIFRSLFLSCSPSVITSFFYLSLSLSFSQAHSLFLSPHSPSLILNLSLTLSLSRTLSRTPLDN